jgi:hypothetical protein
MNYFIPFIVGCIFGGLITRIQLLQKKYKTEKDTVLEKNKQIHSYLGTIVHDLRSPVAAIFSLTEIVLDEKNKLDSEQKEYIGLMNVSAASILENISLILDNAKLEKGMGPDHLENGNPYFTINSTIDNPKHVGVHIAAAIASYGTVIPERIIAGMLQRLGAYFEKDTVLRIHHFRFAREIAKKSGVEHIDVVEPAFGAHIFRGILFDVLLRNRQIQFFRGEARNCFDTVFDVRPELANIGCAREATGHAYNRNAFSVVAT